MTNTIILKITCFLLLFTVLLIKDILDLAWHLATRMKFGTCEQNWDLFGTSLTALFRCSIMSGQRSTFSVSPLPPSLPIYDRKKFFLKPEGQLETKRYLDTSIEQILYVVFEGLPKVSPQKNNFYDQADQ